jgi:hypothetical protein
MRTHSGGMVRNDTSQQCSSVPASTGTTMASKIWPPETELVLSSKNKVNLSLQKPVIRVLLQDAIERVRVSLLFNDAFPDANVALKLVQDSVVAAAERYMPGTTAIHQRLKHNDEYLSKMTSVVRVIFSNKYFTDVICSPVLAFR